MPAPKMYTMPVSGEGMPTELPFPMAGGGASFSPDGSRIAYMPLAGAFAQWKLYRGGRTTKIWIGNLADSAVEEVRISTPTITLRCGSATRSTFSPTATAAT